MPEVHKFIGVFIAGLFTLLWIWGFVARFRKRDPGVWWWRLLAAIQVIVGLQVGVGLLLLAFGYRAPQLLHYAYGVFPAVALVIAHVYARREKLYPWVPFAWAAFFSMGLALRAIMTGLGKA
jgi:hypothetical protein